MRIARELALELLKRNQLFCVWTGQKLKEESLEIDHCFPWSAWPCGDLWNLLPALRSVNQRQKTDRLPSAERLAKARGISVDWWDAVIYEKRQIGDRSKFNGLRALGEPGA